MPEIFEEALKIAPDSRAIARRLFFTNSIDGLVSAIGVNVGAYSEAASPLTIGLSIFGGIVAFSFISAFAGVVLSERAERSRELRELERAMGRSLRGSIYARATTIVPIYVALWSFAGVLAFPTLVASVYLLSHFGLISLREAFFLSTAVAILLMGLLGAYVSSVSGERMVWGLLRASLLGVGALSVAYVFKSLALLLIGLGG